MESDPARAPASYLPASMLWRGIATFGDAVISFVAAVFLTLPLVAFEDDLRSTMTQDDVDALFGLTMIGVWLLVWCLYTSFSIGRTGMTIGKKIGGIVVLGSDGAPIGVRRALVRWLAMWVSIIPLGAGIFATRRTMRNQTWHDKLIDSYVVLLHVRALSERPEGFTYRWRSAIDGGQYLAAFTDHEHATLTQQLFIDELQGRLEATRSRAFPPGSADAELILVRDVPILLFRLRPFHQEDDEGPEIAGVVTDTDIIFESPTYARFSPDDPIQKPGAPWTSRAVDFVIMLVHDEMFEIDPPIETQDT